jgi:Ribbon-helix-helix protein, copG family
LSEGKAVMYTSLVLMYMRRVQIYIDEDLDDSLAREAAQRRLSKAAVIRERLASARSDGSSHNAAEHEIVGWIEERLPDAGSIDDVVYGR